METKSLFVQHQFGPYFQENSPNFILFVKKYYEFLHRDIGFTDTEINEIRDNYTKYVPNPIDIQDIEILKLHSERMSGAISDNFLNDYLLQPLTNVETTIDDEIFATKDDYFLGSYDVNEFMLSNWYDMLSFPEIYDYYTFVKLIRPIQAIKGTLHCTKLFFKIFFDEDVNVYVPKFDIASLDNNFILDDVNPITNHLVFLRDDDYYSEYTYVVLVSKPIDTYLTIINEIYLKYFHPTGFKFKIEQD